ncbi:membrane associated rhomboid family serine protease [Arcticibacter tournemirensis]|uniref:rhomboid family intramembrane serine protease n=1 Tax=Arcticibacter tournemirensis TaxID=699437 RepID=UPI00116EA2F8|nr:rhomboid family intramembrane serine protease [Arcticibacter tournemirensis]TQM46833.1 membrane associated rhomboid family serine protease [Arcticibacter tournemirensis]
MKRSVSNELWYKMVQSGSKLNLFIGINAIVFVIIGLLTVVEFLFTRETPLANWITLYISVPPYLPALLYKFWTPFTYMFAHRELFHFFFNMLWLYWLGRIFEDFLNSRQFTFTYLAGGLSGAFLFILFYNIFPAFKDTLEFSPPLIGASASVMAIVVATATLLPDYALRLLFFGDVKLKYLAIVYVILDILGVAGMNAGGSIAHLGGALLGFVFIKQLQAGHDWSKIFLRKKRLKVIRNNKTPASTNAVPDQEVIDNILDKISKSGYESLTKKEKEQLFKASNKG